MFGSSLPLSLVDGNVTFQPGDVPGTNHADVPTIPMPPEAYGQRPIAALSACACVGPCPESNAMSLATSLSPAGSKGLVLIGTPLTDPFHSAGNRKHVVGPRTYPTSPSPTGGCGIAKPSRNAVITSVRHGRTAQIAFVTSTVGSGFGAVGEHAASETMFAAPTADTMATRRGFMMPPSEGRVVA
jgi:hypothetical protein